MNQQVFAQGQGRLVSRLEQCGLPRQAIGALLNRHTPVRYPKGAQLFVQGAPADVVFAVFSGLVKVYCPCPDGSRILVDLAGPGDLVGYADFSDAGGERSQLFEAHALTGCCLGLFTRHHILEMLKGLEPPVLVRTLELVNSLWASAVHRYATFLGMSLRERLELVLAELGRRFGVSDSRGVMLTPELAQDELAEMIGSSRPMVSKLLTEMAKSGTVVRQGRRYILIRGHGLGDAQPKPGSAEVEGDRQAVPRLRAARMPLAARGSPRTAAA